MSRIPLLGAATAILLLAGCASSLVGPKTEVKLFDPASRVQADPAWPEADWQLAVMANTGNALLDSPRIAVRPSPHQFQTYKGARWVDNAPELVETAVLEGFEDSGKLRAVGRVGAVQRGDFGLFMEVRAFETDYASGRPEAVVEVQANLVQFRAGRVASKRFRRAVPGASPAIESMVEAFGTALSGVTTDLVGWTLVEGNRARAAQAEPAAAGD